MWLQVDPLSEKYPGWNPYVYAYCNPIRFFDPDGSNGWDFLKGVAVGFGKHIASTVASVAGMLSSTPTGYASPTRAMETGMALKTLWDNPNQITEAIENKFEQLTTDFGTSESSGEAVGEILGVVTEVMATKKIVGETEVNVYRTYGDKVDAAGKSWTPINPKNVANFRDEAGLPTKNSGRFLLEGVAKRKNIIISRTAIPLDGNKGGLKEYIINPNNVQLKKVYGVNPPF
jgi:hypothetical protein